MLRAGARHRARHPARRPAGMPRPLGVAAARGARQGPREAAAGPHQGQLPRHRAPPGLPRLRRRQDVRRRRRGRSASAASSACSPRAAYTESRPRIPVLRAQGRRGAGPRPASTPHSHSGKDLHRDPRDLPARRAVPDPDRRAAADRDRACCTCRSAGSCGCSCAATTTAGSSPAWSTCPATATPPPSGCGCRTILLARARRRSASTTPPGSPSRCWPGCTSSSAPTRASRSATSTPAELERRLAEATRSWDDDFADALRAPAAARSRRRACSPALRRRVPRGLQGGLPAARPAVGRPRAGWSRSTSRRRASACTSTEPPDAGPASARFKVFRVGAPLSLSAGAAGAARTWASRSSTSARTRSTGPTAGVYIYDFGLRCPTARRELAEVRPHVEDAFAAVWRGEAEVDGFNALVLRGRADLAAGRGAARVREVPAPGRHRFRQDYIEADASSPYPDIAALLVALFEARFDPALRRCRRGPAPTQADGAGRRRSRGALDDVASLDQDRILRSYLTLIQATLRTNYFQRDADGRPQAVHRRSSSTRRRSRTCPRRGRSSRSSSTRRGSRACTCASARSPAAGCAGRTGARTSAPRCSAWSRRRW